MRLIKSSFVIATGFGLLAAAQSVHTTLSSSTPNLTDAAVARCVDVNGKPCTASQVKAVVAGLEAGKRSHANLAAVQNVSLISADGVLTCEQNDGKPCTAEQVQALNDIAMPMKCTIHYKAAAKQDNR